MRWHNRLVGGVAASDQPRSTGNERDGELLDALRRGDDGAYAGIVERWSGSMVRLALTRVESRALAEEVVQEAWLTVLRDLDRFEGRSAFRTWVFGVVVNLARAQARVERRSVALPAEERGGAVEATRFRPPGERWAGHWQVPPRAWPSAEDDAIVAERRKVVLRSIAALPPRQREVLVLRDLEGCSAPETCNVLGLTDTNQRVLLHRARSHVRRALERFYDEEGRT
jgi:RNA polymerase sigma-70 factor (ECF subfamily)